MLDRLSLYLAIIAHGALLPCIRASFHATSETFNELRAHLFLSIVSKTEGVASLDVEATSMNGLRHGAKSLLCRLLLGNGLKLAVYSLELTLTISCGNRWLGSSWP